MRGALLALLLIAALAGAYFAGRSANRAAPTAAVGRRVLYYVDPMHPSYRSSRPGKAPDCGMPLEPVYADSPGAAALALPPGAVQIDANRLQLAGVQVAKAEEIPGSRTLRLLGRVEVDDARVYRVSAGADGWIQRTFDRSLGSFVHKNEELATFYSPEFYTQVSGYLVALDRQDGAAKSPAAYSPARSVESAELALRSLGMSERQIREVGESRKQPEEIALLAPADGVIVARDLAPGLHFEHNAEFYRIADLSRVWIIADLYEDEAAGFKPGAEAAVIVPGSGRRLEARVSASLPLLDPASRTLKLRLEARNPGFLLRPGMFVDVELPASAPSGVSVPAGAVLDSGRSQRVYVEDGEGVFVPRQVESGARFQDRILITRGLKAGERVVADGAFLVDSESRLKSPAEAPAAPTDAAPTVATPSSAPGAPEQAAIAMAMPQPAAEVDPSCGMKVDPASARAAGNTLVYGGKTYYFCSRRCKERFTGHPEQYLTGKLAAGR